MGAYGSLFDMMIESYSNLWSPGSFSYVSEDYAVLADKLDSQVCKETKEKEEEQVCCDRDQIKVALQWSLKYFLIFNILYFILVGAEEGLSYWPWPNEGKLPVARSSR